MKFRNAEKLLDKIPVGEVEIDTDIPYDPSEEKTITVLVFKASDTVKKVFTTMWAKADDWDTTDNDDEIEMYLNDNTVITWKYLHATNKDFFEKMLDRG